MKIDVKNNIAIVRPQGFLDGNNFSSLLTTTDIEQILSSDYACFFISLKNVVLFNYNAITALSDLLVEHIWAKKKVPVGFCHYDAKKYNLLLKYLGDEPKVALIEEESQLGLFFLQQGRRRPNVLIWCENVVKRGMILYALLDRGANPVVAKDEIEFKREKEEDTYQYIVHRCYLGSAGAIASYIRGNAVVYMLGGFLDSAKMDSFDVAGFQNALSVGFKFFVFDCTNSTGMNSHALNYIVRLACGGGQYTPTFAIMGLPEDKTSESMKSALTKAGIRLYQTFEELDADSSLVIAPIHKKTEGKQKSLTKSQISALPSFIDATIETIEVLTGTKAQKQGLKHGDLETASFSDEYLAASVGFYGGLEGIIALVFHKNTAKKACAVLIGSDDVDDETACDMLGEFVNIIMGKAKTLLARQNLSIKLSLPRTFNSPAALAEALDGKVGVMIDFLFEDDHFRFYLTN